MLQQVLVPLDGSELSAQALNTARKVLEPNGRIILVSVHEYKDLSNFGPYALARIVDERSLLEEEMAHSERYLNRVKEDMEAQGYTVDVRVLRGNAANAIITIARSEGVDAIIMTTHGRTGFRRWIMGSVTSEVLQTAHLPVLVVPSSTASVRNVLEELDQNLDQMTHGDEDAQKKIASVQSDIKEILESDDKTIESEPDTLMDRLQEQVVQLDSDHPYVASAIQQAIHTLSNMGL